MLTLLMLDNRKNIYESKSLCRKQYQDLQTKLRSLTNYQQNALKDAIKNSYSPEILSPVIVLYINACAQAIVGYCTMYRSCSSCPQPCHCVWNQP